MNQATRGPRAAMSWLIAHRVLAVGFAYVAVVSSAWAQPESRPPARQETVNPIRQDSIHTNLKKQRQQQGNPRQMSGLLVFDGARDGNRQVDPQIAVGRRHVLHATNSGFLIFDKQGNYVDGVHQNGFQGGIDPKLFYDIHQHRFGFDLWEYWNQEQGKPLHLSFSESDDPTAAWNTYSISLLEARDGGAVGYSRAWIGYSFPGGDQQTLVLPADRCRAGESATVYHFDGNLGHPVTSQDASDDLYFLKLERRDWVITRITAGPEGVPVAEEVARHPHELEFFGYPPPSPQPGTDQRVASGDRNPKNVVLQSEALWFSHAVNVEGRAAVQWHQLGLDAKSIQRGLLRHPQRNYIQTSLAVNASGDVLVGFQEVGEDRFVSPRLAYRLGGDPPGTLREPIALGEGKAAATGMAWGDYSGCAIDGGNLNDLWTCQSVADEAGKGDIVIARWQPRQTDDDR